MADEALGRHRGGVPPSLPPVFPVRRPGRRADCPACGVSTGRRVCPECHNQLPAEYCANPGKIVALVGAKGSGKSTYIAVLLHELMNRVGAELDASLVPCDDRTIERYKQDFARPLYGRNMLLSTTQSVVNAPLRDPLVYLLTRTVRGRLRSRTASLTLVLFDTAGEDLRSRDVTEPHLRYLGAADAVVFLVDPLELPGARSALSGTALARGGTLEGDPDSDPINVISRVTELLRRRDGDRRLTIPVAVALSKIDALRRRWSASPRCTGPAPRWAPSTWTTGRRCTSRCARCWTSGRPGWWTATCARTTPTSPCSVSRRSAACPARSRSGPAASGPTGSRTRCSGCCTGSRCSTVCGGEGPWRGSCTTRPWRPAPPGSRASSSSPRRRTCPRGCTPGSRRT
nr:hypothetical protein GCM10020093_111540 [Planobispora longispora]